MMTQDKRMMASFGGMLVLGVALTVSASAPLGRYTVNPDNTVLDTKTSLLWQKDAPLTSSIWSVANSYCQTLSLGTGTPAWRLPTVKELQSLVDIPAGGGFDASVFTGPGGLYWSSLAQGSGGEYWFVDVGTNWSNVGQAGDVRCVHGP